jgi:predicted unusual protein kinase regulating ubiquinone biosynthesis (AarF/ABC1/UbiB family)
LQEKGEALPAAVRQMAAKRLLERVAQAYWRMLLLDGLFQADCHPGNILVKPNGSIGVHSCSTVALLSCRGHVCSDN